MFESLIQNSTILLQNLAFDVLQILYILSPIFIPFFLVYICWNLWLGYKRFDFIVKQERILLEIKIPKEIKKTPLAMELFLNIIHQTGGESTWYARNFEGKGRTWFSLELVSIEGEVRFFIWTEKKFKPLLESQIYAHYPEVEVHEAPDYTQFVDLDLNKKSMWGNEFILTKADPYPIKTYIDYRLEKEGIKDEEKSDPMVSMIEFLGSVGKGEQIWIQILVRAHKKDFVKDLSWSERLKNKKWSDKVDWTDPAQKEVKDLLAKLKPESGEGPLRPPTKGEQAIISSIERNIDKLAFNCGIRGIYITDKDKFNPINITGITGAFKQYNSMALNGFKPSNGTDFDYPWQDYKNIRKNKLKREMFALYKRRGYFYYPYRNKKQFVLSSEELATIYHIPGGVAQTPTFSRIASKKSEPPANLPF